jgi:hypothetical protein
MKRTILIIITLSACIGCGESSGIEEHGIMSAPLPVIGDAGPVHQSKSFIIESEVSQGEAELTVTVDTPENASLVILGEENAVAKTSAQNELSGQSFDEPDLKTLNLPSTGRSFNLGNFRKGKQRVNLEKLSKDKVTAIVAQPKSPLNLELQVRPLSVRSGDTATIEARLRDEKIPSQAAVVAEYGTNSYLTLKDDGIAPDAIKGDGIFTAQIIAPDVDTFKKINIRIKAAGSRHNGISFARNSSASILVTRPGTKINTAGISSEKESITIPISAPLKFNARIDVIYGSSNTAVAWSRKDMVTLKKDSIVTISRQAASLSADKAIIRVLNHDTKGLEDEVAIALIPLGSQPVEQNNAVKELPDAKKQSAQAYGD